MAETGYSDGSELPAGGSISREPNPTHPLSFIVSETGEGAVTAVFSGDVAGDFEERGLVVDGVYYATGSAVFSGGKTTVTFTTDLQFVDGVEYECEFGLTSDNLPAAFSPSDWTIEDAESGNTLNVLITGTPARAAKLRYKVGSGSTITRPNLDSFQITGLTNDAPYSVVLYAENAAGLSAASESKTATPTGGGSGAFFTSDPEITGTRGGTLTGVDATYNGTDTLTRGWYYDGVLQSTAGTFNDTNTQAVVEYRNTLVTANVSVSAYREVVTTAPLFFDDFSDAVAGKPLADEYYATAPTTLGPVPNGPGVPGYISRTTNSNIAELYKTAGGGGIYSSSNSPGRVTKSTGSSSHYAIFKIALSGEASDQRFALVVGEGASAFLQIRVRISAPSWTSPSYAWINDPSGTNLASSAPAQDGDIIGMLVDKDAGLLYIDLNGTVLNPSGYSFSTATGDRVGMGLEEGMTTTGVKLVHAIGAYSSPQVLVSGAPEEGTVTKTKLVLTLLNPVPSSTDTEYRIDIVNGPMIQGWTATGDVGKHEVDYDLPDEYEGREVVISARNVGGTASVSRSSSIHLPVFPKPFRKGVNEGYQSEWALSAAEKNIARNGSFREYDSYNYLEPSELGAEEDGIIRHWAAGKTPGCRILLPQAAPLGTYTIEYPTSITMTFENLIGYTVKVAPSSGYAEIEATQEGGKSGAMRINGTIPSGGFQVLALPKDDPNPTQNFHTVTRDNYAGLGVSVIRFMTSLGTNTNIQETLGYVRGAGAGHGAVTLSHCVDLCNDLGADLYIAVPHYYSDAAKADLCEYVAANLSPSLKFIVEWSNEVWNNIFPVYHYAAREGCREGLYSSAGDTPIPGLLKGNVNPSGGALLQDYNEGDIIYASLYGMGVGVWQANKNNVAGETDKIASSSNAAWTLIANNAACMLAQRRYYSEQARNLYDIALEAFDGDKSRIELAAAWQQGGGIGGLSDILSWNDLALHVKHVLMAPYFGGDLSAYNSTGIANWAKADKDLLYTNVSAWRDKFFLAIEPYLTAKISMIQSWYTSLYGWYELNYPQMRLYMSPGSYECEQHFAPSLEGGDRAWPDPLATVRAEETALMRDARWGPLLEEYYGTLKELGGMHCIFERIGTLWGQCHSETDTDMIRYETLASITEG